MTNSPAPDTPNRSTTQTAPTGRPRWPAWLKVVIVPVLFFAIIYLAPLPMIVLQPFVGDDLAPGLILVLEVIRYLLVIATTLGVLWLMTRFLQRTQLRDIGIRWSQHSLPLAGLGALLSIAVMVPIGVVLQAGGLLREHGPHLLDDFPVWLQVTLAVAMGILLQAIPEEWLFRGWIMTLLRDKPTQAVLVSTVVFGVPHLISAGGQESAVDFLTYMLMAAAFGLSAAVLAAVLRSVWVAIGIHAGIHLGNIIAVALGVGTGPWFWGLIAVAHLAIALYAWRTRGLPHQIVFDR